MRLFDRFDVFTLYAYTIGINAIFVAILVALYLKNAKRPLFLQDFLTGFGLLLIGSLLSAARDYFPSNIVLPICNSIILLGSAFSVHGFLELFEIRKQDWHKIPFTFGPALAILFVLLPLNLSDRIFIFSSFTGVLIAMFVIALWPARSGKMTKPVIFILTLISVTYLGRGLQAIGTNSSTAYFEIGSTQRLFLVSILLLEHVRAALTLITIGAYYLQTVQKIHAKNDLLVSEMNHRVNNSLNRIIGMISIMKESYADHSFQEEFGKIQNRVFSISHMHEQLYKHPDGANIRLDIYIPQLISQVIHSFGMDHVNLNVRTEKISINADQGLFVGMIINELSINSCKYAFSNNLPGEVDLQLYWVSEKKRVIGLIYSDSGEGLKGKKADGFGSMILKESLQYLGAEYIIDSSGRYSIDIQFQAKAELQFQQEAII